MHIVIDRQWDGSPAAPAEWITLDLRARGGALEIAVDAPLHGDPPPPSPPGSTPGLWNFEVVELFLHAPDDRYLELEFGPHGHSLALQFHGVRQLVATVQIDFHADPPADGRWTGEARVPPDLLPRGLARWNAHAIHGQGDTRRYLSALPAGGARPDFHRPDITAALDLALSHDLARMA